MNENRHRYKQNENTNEDILGWLLVGHEIVYMFLEKYILQRLHTIHKE